MVWRLDDSYIWITWRLRMFSAVLRTGHVPSYHWLCLLLDTIWEHLFLWKITQGALALGEKLERRGIINSITCHHYGEPKTTDHVFLHCTFTRQIWSSHIWASRFDPTECVSFTEAFLCSTEAPNLPPLGVAVNLFPWICWGIWTARNFYVFENRISMPVEIISKSIRTAREWSLAQSTPTSAPSTHHHHMPLPISTSPSVVCFTDAAWQAGSNRAGCGWILKDHRDECLQQGTRTFNHTSLPLMAEALAVRSALLNARSWHYQNLC